MRLLLLSALGLLLGTIGQADSMPVPLDLQAALFKKIFDYDRTLRTQQQMKVLILYPAEEPQASRDLVSAFDRQGVAASSAPASELAVRIGEAGVGVVYLLPGVDPAAVEPHCLENGVLSVSGVPELVESGAVAIAIGSREQKPKILIHLRRVKAERHELAAGLLSLAEVIR